MPDELSDYLFAESVGFRVLPWEVDDLPIDTYTLWSQVIGTYQDAKSAAELRRQKEEQGGDGRGRRARR